MRWGEVCQRPKVVHLESAETRKEGGAAKTPRSKGRLGFSIPWLLGDLPAWPTDSFLSNRNPDILRQMNQREKLSIRQEAIFRRRAQDKKDETSHKILQHLRQLAVYQQASTVLFYIGVRSEVRTIAELSRLLGQGDKRVVVPYCVDQHLELFHLDAIDELESGAYRLLEPKRSLRSNPDRSVEITEVDLVVVPGIAFDRQGGRLGNGFGYYDRLLAKIASTTSLVALAYDCQMFPLIPMDEHDIRMDVVITEKESKQL